jgi:type I restriction enzyme R subunit
MIKDHIASSMQITVDDFDNVPFYDKGGVMKVYNLFGDKFNTILDELNEVLAA